jgi:hypothetical protein
MQPFISSVIMRRIPFPPSAKQPWKIGSSGDPAGSGISFKEREAADGQPILIGLTVGDEALEVSFKLGQLPLEVVSDPHKVASFLDTRDWLIEKVDFGMHAGSLNCGERPAANLVPSATIEDVPPAVRCSKMTPNSAARFSYRDGCLALCRG